VSLDRWVGFGAVFVGVALGSCAHDIAGVGSPGEATQIAFTVQPGGAVAGAVISPPVQVTFENAAGEPVPNASGAVTIVIGNDPNGGTLAGTATVAAVNGVATFSALSVSRAGVAYTLIASSQSLPVATSAAFNVSATTVAMFPHDAPTPR
jgi:hypothetical protein